MNYPPIDNAEYGNFGSFPGHFPDSDPFGDAATNGYFGIEPHGDFDDMELGQMVHGGFDLNQVPNILYPPFQSVDISPPRTPDFSLEDRASFQHAGNLTSTNIITAHQQMYRSPGSPPCSFTSSQADRDNRQCSNYFVPTCSKQDHDFSDYIKFEPENTAAAFVEGRQIQHEYRRQSLSHLDHYGRQQGGLQDGPIVFAPLEWEVHESGNNSFQLGRPQLGTTIFALPEVDVHRGGNSSYQQKTRPGERSTSRKTGEPNPMTTVQKRNFKKPRRKDVKQERALSCINCQISRRRCDTDNGHNNPCHQCAFRNESCEEQILNTNRVVVRGYLERTEASLMHTEALLEQAQARIAILEAERQHQANQMHQQMSQVSQSQQQGSYYDLPLTPPYQHFHSLRAMERTPELSPVQAQRQHPGTYQDM